MVVKKKVSEARLAVFASKLISQIREEDVSFTNILAIARGGIPLGETLSKALEIPLEEVYISFYEGEEKRNEPLIDISEEKILSEGPVLIVDDLVDTGATVQTLTAFLKERNIEWKLAVFYTKPTSSVRPDYYVESTEEWIVFPWEKD